jgi:hypothetical protein
VHRADDDDVAVEQEDGGVLVTGTLACLAGEFLLLRTRG